MRGELTAAMLHDPEILFLDEPTIGLDVVAKARVREFLAEINRERGVTVLLTTHDLADIERLCSRLLIIDHGRVIYDGDDRAPDPALRRGAHARRRPGGGRRRRWRSTAPASFGSTARGSGCASAATR